MRIGLVCPYSLDMPGGVATHVLGLARWLAGEGHDPFVVAPGVDPVDAGVEVHLVGPAVGLRFNGSTANLALRRPQSRRAAELARSAEVVHVHEPLTPGIAYAAGRAARRLVVTHHAHWSVPAWAGAALRRRARALGERTSIAVSPAAAVTARAATGVEPLVIPNAIELPPRRESRPAAPPVVLFVGRRDDPRKGFRVFEGVASELAGEARFVAVGPGRGSDAPVEMHGQLPAAELAGWLDSASVVVAPNLGGESFGLVLVEALAHGCGLVASSLPAFREVVGDGPVVEWFPPSDVPAAASAVRSMLSRGRDGEAARDIARRFSWEAVGPSVLRCYRRALLG